MATGLSAYGLLAWIARKAPDALVDVMMLLMFRLRQVPDAILPSDEIAEMAKQARDACINSKQLERLWRSDPRFSEILDPKRIKSAFVDEICLEALAARIECDYRSRSGKTPDWFQS